MFKTPQLIILAILSITTAGGLFFFLKPTLPSTQPPVACTLEAKICPDGSSVGRTSPNCEFEKCPSSKPDVIPVPAGWETYSIPELGFSFNYPSTAEVRVQESFPPIYVVYQKGPTQRGQTELYDGLNVVFQPLKKENPTASLQQTVEDSVTHMVNDHTTELIKPVTPITINGILGYTYTVRGLGEFTTIAIELPQDSQYLSITNGSSDPEGVTTFAELSKTIIESVTITK